MFRNLTFHVSCVVVFVYDMFNLCVCYIYCKGQVYVFSVVVLYLYSMYI